MTTCRSETPGAASGDYLMLYRPTEAGGSAAKCVMRDPYTNYTTIPFTLEMSGDRQTSVVSYSEKGAQPTSAGVLNCVEVELQPEAATSP